MNILYEFHVVCTGNAYMPQQCIGKSCKGKAAYVYRYFTGKKVDMWKTYIFYRCFYLQCTLIISSQIKNRKGKIMAHKLQFLVCLAGCSKIADSAPTPYNTMMLHWSSDCKINSRASWCCYYASIKLAQSDPNQTATAHSCSNVLNPSLKRCLPIGCVTGWSA